MSNCICIRDGLVCHKVYQCHTLVWLMVQHVVVQDTPCLTAQLGTQGLNVVKLGEADE